MTKNDFSIIHKAKTVNVLSLFTSASTLVCCALPATMVAIGSAATLTSLLSSFPQLIWISEHKLMVFTIAAVMLILAGFMQWQARNAPCPADANLAAICIKARKSSKLIYWFSVLVFLVGAFFAFIAPLFI